MNKNCNKYLEDTLKIRNIPIEVSDCDKERLLIHFGACGFKIIESKMNRTCTVFAKFASADRARNALVSLHQAEMFGTRLCAEFAKAETAPSSFNEFPPPPASQHLPNHKNTKLSPCHSVYGEFLERLNAWNKSVGFEQPPPPHLKYKYPKANLVTINNISHALATVPKFYTQVLHLMNRMNLPPPFANSQDTVSQLTKSELSLNEAIEEELTASEADDEDRARVRARIQAQARNRSLKRPLLFPPSSAAAPDPDFVRKKFKMHHHFLQSVSQTSFESNSDSQIDTADVFDIVSLQKPS